ncbi:MAG: hypothetical protein K9L79_08160 [Methylobacter tundripaludum]|nr:hypothetical protein [Methylobacter tundripaludum]
MPIIRIIFAQSMQPTDYSSIGVPVILRSGINEIDVLHWLNLRVYLNPQIEGGFVKLESESEVESAIKAFRKEIFYKLESLGLPAVKVATESGEFSKGALKLLADEWILSKEESREDSRDAREAESLSISRKALLISKCANIIAISAVIIAIIGIFVQK